MAHLLQEFRKTHPILHREVRGHQWSYISSGSGDTTLVVLPGLSRAARRRHRGNS
jgi:hypothetical protein